MFGRVGVFLEAEVGGGWGVEVGVVVGGGFVGGRGGYVEDLLVCVRCSFWVEFVFLIRLY